VLNLEKGQSYRVTFNKPKTGPYRNFAKAPIEGEFVRHTFMGPQFNGRKGLETAPADQIKTIEEL
jgi:hypothetical protein